jgi:hypothetical protein
MAAAAISQRSRARPAREGVTVGEDIGEGTALDDRIVVFFLGKR